jgi:CRISPR system Cascade subunit CasB
MKYDFLNDEEQISLKIWHASLDRNRGDRSRLRRAESPEDILLTRAFFNFLQEMPNYWQENKPMLVSATVAGVLAQVKENKQIPSKIHESNDLNTPKKIMSFAEQLGTPLKGKSKVPISELRFQQLQKSRTVNDFYRLTLRAISLLGGEANIYSLANDIVQWHQEFNQKEFDRKSSNRLAVNWATDYFTALSKHTK